MLVLTMHPQNRIFLWENLVRVLLGLLGSRKIPLARMYTDRRHSNYKDVYEKIRFKMQCAINMTTEGSQESHRTAGSLDPSLHIIII